MRMEQRSIGTPERVLVTGDTHLTPGRDVLPGSLLEAADRCDLTVHTGDVCTVEALQRLKALGPVLAVCGNNEAPALGSQLPDAVEFHFGEFRCLVTHGHLEPGSGASGSVRRAYAGKYDLVIYGHSHMPEWKEDSGTWFLNPGSPTQRRRAPVKTFAELRIDSAEKLHADFTEIV
jgi:uncharacterized protein